MTRLEALAVVSGVLIAAGSVTAVADAESCLGSFSVPGKTGEVVSCEIPAGINALHVVAIGGKGGGYYPGVGPTAGGDGAVVESDLAITPGESLDVYVGGMAGRPGET